MSHTITIADDVYMRLDRAARQYGVSIEDLLRSWPLPGHSPTEAELQARHDAVQRSVALYAESAERYGEFHDSTDLVREDRLR